jgi:uncharacterized protein YrrD
MQLKGQDVIGLKIISVKDGKELGKVDDIVYEPNENKVKALLVSAGGIFSDAKVIPFELISSIGKDAVMIKDENEIKNAGETDKNVAHIAKKGDYLTKTKIVTQDGTELGNVTDIYFDDQTGDVQEFEVSKGGVQDLATGRKRVKVQDIVTVGKDATIVSNYTEADVENQEGGAKGALNQAKEQVKQKVEEIKQDPRVQDVKQKVQSGLESAQEKVQGAVQNVQDKAQDAQADLQQGDDSQIKQQAQQKADQVKGAVQNAAQNVQGKVEEVKDDVMDQRKKDATGKYLSKTVLLPDDTALGQAGDMITYEMLQSAEQAGILDQVLNNTTELPTMGYAAAAA